MTHLRPLLFLAVGCALVQPGRSAVLVYTDALRLVQSAGMVGTPESPFGLFDGMVSTGQTEPGGLPDSTAQQRSLLGATAITVDATVTGNAGRGMAVLKVAFHLEWETPYSIVGMLELTAGSGFSCISLVNLAQRDPVLLNEVLSAPNAGIAAREIAAGGILPPGDYEVEAIIYAGGGEFAEQGALRMVFSIPEPDPLVMAAAAAGAVLLVRRRRIQNTAATLTNSRAPATEGNTRRNLPPPRS